MRRRCGARAPVEKSGEMAETAQTLQEQARTAMQTLTSMEQQLRETHQQVQGLGFIGRGFVERDISSATGRGFGEWIAAAVRLRECLNPVASGSGGATSARQILTDELPRLAALRGYLEKAPQKLNAVPGAVLKPQQRGEVLAQVGQQVQALQTLEGQLAAILQALPAAG
jgi:hypothetical protein